jgi:hypothetical protein
MKKIIVSYILCSLLAFTLVGCGGISISFNSDDKASQKEVKQDQNQSIEDKSNATDKSTQEQAKQDQDANSKDDKSNVTVNITPPQTQNNKDVVVIRDPIPVDISNGDFIFPNSDHAYLTQNQVSSLNNYQLGIARNEIYARHGYIFSLEQFRSYFSAQRWYTPITKDVTLNDIETYNVNLIKAEEDRRGIRWN